MTALDPADLVVIAGRALGIGTDAALAQMDITAAQDALAAACPPGQAPGPQFRDRAAAAAAGVGLVQALLRHRPFPRHGQLVAVAAGLQLLSLNGWRADLNPAATAAVVVEALASGRLTAADAAAWLSPRLRPEHRAGTWGRVAMRDRPRWAVARPAARMPGARTGPGRTRPGRTVPGVARPGARDVRAGTAPGGARPGGRTEARPRTAPGGRAVAGALLTAAVTGVTLLAVACSRAPEMPASPAGGAAVVQHSAGLQPARPAGPGYAACLRAHGVASLPHLPAGAVTVTVPASLNSAPLYSAARACPG